ncbi:MAG: hypothetical protein A2014_03880 [Spirochaetes bacterium GWF1_49_6]|nr:MAG: hypothetical protein A2014_03880 [Spirochaetes bacterium GWF1_49_6]
MKAQTEMVKSGRGGRIVLFVILLTVSIGCMVLGAILKDLWWGKGFFFVSILLLVPMLRIVFSGKKDEDNQDTE